MKAVAGGLTLGLMILAPTPYPGGVPSGTSIYRSIPGPVAGLHGRRSPHVRGSDATQDGSPEPRGKTYRFRLDVRW